MTAQKAGNSEDIAVKNFLFALAFCLVATATFAKPAPVKTFSSEDAAHINCPLDKVVWLDTRTHVYYFRNSKKYADSANGGFACLQEVKKAGNKPGK